MFLMLLSVLIYSQSTPVKTAILTPLDSNNNGAEVMFNIQEVSVSDTHWDVNVLHQTGWNFIIKTDERFAIDTIYDSTIEFTTNIYQSPNTQALIFGFTTDNKRYISTSIPMDSFGKVNKIYPLCSLSFAFPSAFGDIAAIPKTDRSCDIANSDCNNWEYMLPYNTGINSKIANKLTFKFKYRKQTNEIIFIYQSSSFAPGFVQQCRFTNQFVSNNGLKIYISGYGPTESYAIESFEIKSVSGPTALPTPMPIIVQTTFKPTQNPTDNTISPTNNPTLSPSNKPSAKPSYNPIQFPTNNPTDNTISPSKPPSNFPTISPSKNPTTSFPTSNPSIRPTPFPTIRPTPLGKQWGAYNQLCNIPSNSQYQCEYSTDMLKDTLGAINCMTPYDCCMCNTIECGLNGEPCTEIVILGDYGIFGVQEIFLIGTKSDLVNPISIDCGGIGSCQNTIISAVNAGIIQCDGENACQNAHITVIDPINEFLLNCGGISSCEGLNIDIIIPNTRGNMCNRRMQDIFYITKIACNDNRACKNMQITIENSGCDKVIIRDLECIQPNSCNNANFNLIGDIAIENCQCGASCDTTSGLDQCFMSNLNLYNFACNNERECFQKQKIIENPRNGFEFICAAMRSCSYGEFIIKLNDNPPKLEIVEYLGIKISGDYAAQHATFIIENTQTNGKSLDINVIECNGYRACEWTTFITGVGVNINSVSCTYDACDNCYIKESINSVGVPCDPAFVSSLLQI